MRPETMASWLAGWPGWQDTLPKPNEAKESAKRDNLQSANGNGK